MRIVIDTYAWAQKADLSSAQLESLRSALTITPRKVGDHPGETPGPIQLFSENSAVFGMPRQFFLGRRKPAHQVEFRTTEGDKTTWPGDLKFAGTLREEQARGRVHVAGMLRGGSLGGIIRAVPGFGKTVLACAIMAELQVPTLVVVHKEFLMDQWRKRIEEYLPGAVVGIAQAQELEFKGCHIVLGMVQTLADKDYGPDFNNYFGLTLVDECVAGDSVIDTDCGRIPISELGSHPSIRVLTFSELNRKWEYRKVLRWLPRPNRKTLTISTEDQRIRCTPEHLIMTDQGWVEARNLRIGSVLLLPVPVGAVGASQPSMLKVENVNVSLDTVAKVKAGLIASENFVSREWSTSFQKVTAIVDDPTLGEEPVFDLEVEGNHNFVANGLLVHNCHRIGAATWAPVPAKFPARWRLGLSATPKRKDGADAVFHHHIGEVIFSSKEVRMKPKVRKVWITPDLFKIVHTANFNPSLIKKGLLLRFMCVSAGRNRVIVEQIIQAVKAGRKCLVLSERLQHLRDMEMLLYKQWGDEGDKPSVGFYIGGQEEEVLDKAAKAQVIFATSQLVQEGLDIPPLDTIFLTCPMGDVEQAVGRILRPFEGKKEPIVVDFREDHIGLCKRYGEFRDKFYAKQAWTP